MKSTTLIEQHAQAASSLLQLKIAAFTHMNHAIVAAYLTFQAEKERFFAEQTVEILAARGAIKELSDYKPVETEVRIISDLIKKKQNEYESKLSESSGKKETYLLKWKRKTISIQAWEENEYKNTEEKIFSLSSELKNSENFLEKLNNFEKFIFLEKQKIYAINIDSMFIAQSQQESLRRVKFLTALLNNDFDLWFFPDKLAECLLIRFKPIDENKLSPLKISLSDFKKENIEFNKGKKLLQDCFSYYKLQHDCAQIALDMKNYAAKHDWLGLWKKNSDQESENQYKSLQVETNKIICAERKNINEIFDSIISFTINQIFKKEDAILQKNIDQSRLTYGLTIDFIVDYINDELSLPVDFFLSKKNKVKERMVISEFGAIADAVLKNIQEKTKLTDQDVSALMLFERIKIHYKMIIYRVAALWYQFHDDSFSDVSAKITIKFSNIEKSEKNLLEEKNNSKKDVVRDKKIKFIEKMVQYYIFIKEIEKKIYNHFFIYSELNEEARVNWYLSNLMNEFAENYFSKEKLSDKIEYLSVRIKNTAINLLNLAIPSDSKELEKSISDKLKAEIISAKKDYLSVFLGQKNLQESKNENSKILIQLGAFFSRVIFKCQLLQHNKETQPQLILPVSEIKKPVEKKMINSNEIKKIETKKVSSTARVLKISSPEKKQSKKLEVSKPLSSSKSKKSGAPPVSKIPLYSSTPGRNRSTTLPSKSMVDKSKTVASSRR